MNKRRAVRWPLAVAVVSVAWLASGAVQAQSGKRICGQWGALPNEGGYVGILVEVQNKGDPVRANAACDKLKSISPEEVFASVGWSKAVAAAMQWTVQGTTACESVGKYFVSTAQPNVDMCQYMGGYSNYVVRKDADSTSTLYFALSPWL